MSFLNEKSIGILYNYPSEYNAIALELLRRKFPVEVVNVRNLVLDPSKNEVGFSLIFNDLSTPSGFLQTATAPEVFSGYSRHFEISQLKFTQGRILNSSTFIDIVGSRLRQLSIFNSLDLPFPKTKVAHNIQQLVAIAPELRFPLLLKRNKLFDNNPVQKFESLTDLLSAIIHAKIPLKDDVFIVQEYHAPRSSQVIRVDILNGRFLGARKLFVLKDKNESSVADADQLFTPGPDIVKAAEEIARVARIDLGSIEYFVDRASNKVYFNAIQPFHFSNQFKDSSTQLELIGDFFERRLQKIREVELAI